MDQKPTGTIKLPNVQCLALWQHELTGQFSDGMWENSGPHGHWRFWCSLEASIASVGEDCKVTTSTYCDKSNYSLSRLIPIIGDRMVNLARMAVASAMVPGATVGYEQRIAAEAMPVSYEVFCVSASERTRKAVSDELARQYYQVTYTVKDLRADLKRIRAVMDTVKP